MARSERLNEGYYEHPATRGFADITSARHGQEAPLKAEMSRYERDRQKNARRGQARPSQACDVCGRKFPHGNKWILIEGQAIEAPQSGDLEAAEAWRAAGFAVWQTWTMDNHGALYHDGGPQADRQSIDSVIGEKCMASGFCSDTATVEVTLPTGAEVMMCQTHADNQPKGEFNGVRPVFVFPNE